MDRSLIKSMMPSLVAGHVPRNVRSFKYRVFDDQPLSSTLGFAIDPQPFDGKVVAATDDAIVVKLKPSEFAVLDPSLVTTVPAEGQATPEVNNGVPEGESQAGIAIGDPPKGVSCG